MSGEPGSRAEGPSPQQGDGPSITGSDSIHPYVLGVRMDEGRILDKLDRQSDQLSQMLVSLGVMQEVVKRIPDHEARIRGLERWRWTLVGVSGLLTTAFTIYAASSGGPV